MLLAADESSVALNGAFDSEIERVSVFHGLAQYHRSFDQADGIFVIGRLISLEFLQGQRLLNTSQLFRFFQCASFEALCFVLIAEDFLCDVSEGHLENQSLGLVVSECALTRIDLHLISLLLLLFGLSCLQNQLGLVGEEFFDSLGELDANY